MTDDRPGELGDYCRCPVADGLVHYWHPTVCRRSPVRPAENRPTLTPEPNRPDHELKGDA